MTETRKKNTNKNPLINRNSKKKSRKKRVFTKSHYSSGDGMLTSVWGPSMWHYLHTMSFNYPLSPTLEDKKHYMEFIKLMQYVLPCKYCRMNLRKNFKKLPITMKNMENRETFSKYIYQLHELVNKMLNKNSHLTYSDVRERYEHFRSRCTLDIKNIKINVKKTRKKKENGCTEPLYGKKSKCVIKIVPQEEKGSTFQMDKKCIKIRK